MYFLHAAVSIGDDFRRQIKYDPKAASALSALQEGKYDIYFEVLEDQCLLYQAFPKENPALPVLSFVLTPEKEAFEDSQRKPLRGANVSLAYFIYRLDWAASENKGRRRYGDFFDTLNPEAQATSEEIARYLEAKVTLSLLREKLESSSSRYEIQEKGKAKLLYSFAFVNDDSVNCDLRVGYGKAQPLSDLPGFIAATLRHEKIPLSNGMIFCIDDNLDEKESTALSYFCRHSRNPYRYEVILENDEFVDLCFLLRGNVIYIDRDRYVLPKEISKVEMSIGPDGGLTCNRPTIVPGVSIRFGKKRALAYGRDGVELLEFENATQLTLYEFGYTHPGFPFDKMGKEIATQILPLAYGEIDIDPDFQKNKAIPSVGLSFYADYDEDAAMVRFETHYLLSSRQVPLKNWLAASKINKSRLDFYEHALKELGLPLQGELPDENALPRLLRGDFSILRQAADVYLSDNIATAKWKPCPQLEAVANSGEDWFSLSLHAADYSPEELKAILEAYRKKRKFIRLGQDFVDLAGLEGNGLLRALGEDFALLPEQKLPLFQALKLTHLEQEGLSLSESLRVLLNSLKDFASIDLSEMDKSIYKHLRPYQKDGVRWLISLASHGLAGILSDEMGLGKSLELIAFLSMQKLEAPVLIVCPKSLIYNWRSEFAHWNPKQKCVVIDGHAANRQEIIASMENGVVYVMSYDSLRSDIDSFEPITFGYLILDEGQYIANALAKKSRAVKALKADHRFVLTGTPIQNSLLDLWSIFDFLLPGYFPPYATFKREYGSLEFSDEAHQKALEAKIAPFLLKREKKDVLQDLPKKEESILTLAMAPEQRKVYEAYLYEAQAALGKVKEEGRIAEKKIMILAQLTRLRQLCVDPKLFLQRDIPSGKIEAVLGMTSNILAHGHKILIFSSFATALANLEALFADLGIRTGYIHGATKAEDRISLAEAFNQDNDDIQVMLVSLKAGGTGLNLIGADTVILLDPWWNLAAENQASDRAHRIGQKRNVAIYKLVCSDSVEEKVISLQAKKKELSDLLKAGEDGLKAITDEDIEFLLS